MIYLKENLHNISFSDVKVLASSVPIKLSNKEKLSEIIDILSSDKRKNVLSLAKKIETSIQKEEAEYIRVRAMYMFDKQFSNFRYVAGVDEVGRGPLAGPIVGAAVILDFNNLGDIILGIKDSKVLSEQRREELDVIIREKALAYSITVCDNKQIDTLGIAHCNNKIFLDACKTLPIEPQLVLSDGYPVRNLNKPNKFVIKGDAKSASIACASIIAKVYRDRLMKEYDSIYPGYGFKDNVGYGTQKHVDAIHAIGTCEIHRMSFLNNILSKK
ncbi:ribonuclease HII [Clostridium folliculivorans]|uniref:ribonuclease HII n=1 Tax=Clostridium folliculivorans TaxID=2886038 RepID=UPI0021C42A6B|nr:ribonuclease HII [Clostridium folliculivorans]